MRGYDSTLEVQDNKAGQYKYTVGDSWYIITECTSDSQVEDDMRGQEIRLWKAYENGDTNKMPVVIKGVCLDNGDKAEGNIWTLKDMIDEEISKRHSLTLADNGLVSVPPGLADKNGFPSPEMTKKSSSYADTQSTARPQTIFVAAENSRFSGGARPRNEYRITLKEHTPYFDLRRLKTMFEALRDTIIILCTIWSKGFTDRDISAATVLWDEESKCATLMDLDLLAHAENPMIRRIGTPHFMATELYEGQYLFPEEEDKPPTPEVGVDAQTFKLPASGFRHNPIHDLESVWWLAVWTLSKHVPKSQVKSRYGVMALESQMHTYEYRLCTRSCWRPDRRPSAFLKPGSLLKPPLYLPVLFSSAIKYADKFACCLWTHYSAAELDIATLHENKFETLHQDLIDVVTALLSSMPDDLELLLVSEAIEIAELM